MEPKGYVRCKHEFVATKLWPDNKYSFIDGIEDLEKAYKEALAGKQVIVLDISVDNAAYLVYAKTSTGQPFIWTIEKDDTENGSFMPLKWKFGVLMPANITPIEEFRYLAEHLSDIDSKKYQKP
jgi:hypothetical protein